MGRQLFKSPEYANRNRDNHWFVYDLYWAYLQRDPDSGGWSGWENAVTTIGRDAVRAGFEQSTEFATKVSTLCPGSTGSSAPIPTDGLASLAFDSATNRITTAGFQYDAAGNQTRIVRADGSAQKFQYDAANRLVKVRDDYNYTIQAFTYGDDNQRLITQDGDDTSNYRTYYATDGDAVIAEYSETPASPTAPQWSKSYIYLGARLLSTLEPNGSGGEAVRYHHPDRLGTRVITTAAETNPMGTTAVEQVALPFGTALDNESTGATNRRFTSYDRSATTGLDYAINRHYDSQQGRFTQVDPIGMSSTSLANPQSLNLYSYAANDPINRIAPSGLFWGKVFGFLKKVVKVVAVALAIAMAIAAVWIAPEFGPAVVAGFLAMSAMLFGMAFGPNWLKEAIALTGTASGIYMQKPGIIWNFRSAGAAGAMANAWLTTLGPIATYLILRDPSQHSAPTPTHDPGPPCAWEEERDMRQAATLFGGSFNTEPPPNNWQFTLPAGATEESIADGLKRGGFDEIFNPFHSGTDLEKKINGRWYHFTVNDPWFGSLYITEHWERSQPSSLKHIGQAYEHWQRPSDAECAQRKLASVSGGAAGTPKHSGRRRP